MALKLKLQTQPDVPLEADCISPDRVQSLSSSEVGELIVFHGNRQVPDRRIPEFTIRWRFEASMDKGQLLDSGLHQTLHRTNP